MFQAIQAQIASCTISYYNVAPPAECEYYTDENGAEEEECSSVGSAAAGAALTPLNPYMNEPDFALSEIEFSGRCDTCILTVYSQTSLKGCSVTKAIYEGHFDVFPGIWTRKGEPKSWDISCFDY